MTFQINQAARENVKLKIGMSGPSGSGKTYSALQLAYGITGDWAKVALADTENRSALYYSDMGPWRHIPVDPNQMEGAYHPRNFVQLIKFAEHQPGVECLIIDSISHEWEGQGGCLDLVDKINKGFAGWKTVTPLHNSFMDAMRLSSLHVIGCMRSKTDYVVEQTDRGKAAPRKVGLKSIQREGTDYDFGLLFDLAMNHHAQAAKDRTGLFAPRGEFLITPAVGQELVAWSRSGIDAPPPPPAIGEVGLLGVIFDKQMEAHRKWLRRELNQRQFTSNEDATGILRKMAGRKEDQLDEAIAEHLAEVGMA